MSQPNSARNYLMAGQSPSAKENTRHVPYVKMEAQVSQSHLKGRPRRPLVNRYWTPSTFLVRVIFNNLEEVSKDEEVSVTLFRRVLRRLLDSFDPSIPVNLEAFGSEKGSLSMTWADVRTAIDEGHLPKVQLSWAQSFFVTLDDSSSSWLSLFYHTLIYVAILVNIAVLVLGSVHLDDVEEWKGVLTIAFQCSVRLFIFDYFARAASVMACPLPLMDEAWLIETVSTSKLAFRSLHTSPLERLTHWATQPSNLIDFLSIVPALLSMLVIRKVHTPLSVLRMLRLLRVIRVLRAFKAVGKWVTTLQVLGEAFYSSLGAILVLAIYISLFSMVAGAILYQQEHHLNEDYEDAPAAMRTVAEMFIGKSFSVSYSIVSALVLACVGMFKGIIFLLPMEKVKAATHHSQAQFDRLNALRRQVELEESSTPMAWVDDFACPSVRVKVMEDPANPSAAPFIGNLNVPLWEDELIDAVVQVPLNGPRGLFQRKPEVLFLVQWKPTSKQGSPGSAPNNNSNSHSSPSNNNSNNHHLLGRGEPLPHGELKLTALKGVRFPTARQWVVELEVPTGFSGDASTERWLSGSSSRGQSSPTSSTPASDPEWDIEVGQQAFRIDWTPSPTLAVASSVEAIKSLPAGQPALHAGQSNGQSTNGNGGPSAASPAHINGATPLAEAPPGVASGHPGFSADFEHQVLHLLQSQHDRFARLEKQVSRLERAIGQSK